MKKVLLLATLIFIVQIASSQEEIKTQVIESIIEDLSEKTDNEELDLSEVQEDLEFFFENPLNLNTATNAQLNSLHFLSVYQINNLLEHRKKYGLFNSFYELQLVEGFDMETIEKLIYFTKIEPIKEVSIDYKKYFSSGRHQIFTRWQRYLEPRLGYTLPDTVNKSRYLGDPNKLYIKYQYKYKDLVHWGITAEKDAGEQFFKGAQKYGFDFYSAHFQINKIGRIKKLIIGDFQAQFGEGLCMWSGLAFSKNSMVIDIKKKPRGLRYYSSSDENLFLRGIGVTFEIDKYFDLSLFGSYHKIDANINIDTLNEATEDIYDVTSILNTGYHRTKSEIQNRKTLPMRLWGMNAHIHQANFIVGFNFVQTYFDYNLNTIKYPYQLFMPQDKLTTNSSIYYQFSIKKIYAFGEIATNFKGGFAGLVGFTANLDHKLSLAVLYRNYQPQYYSFFSAAFGESTNSSNEKGIYAGLIFTPLAKIKISFYADYFEFPWLKYRLNDVYSNGIEYFTQVDYYPTRSISMNLRVKQEIKSENVSSDALDQPLQYPISREKFYLRYHLKIQLSKNLYFKTRFDVGKYAKGDTSEYGFMVYQDLNYKFKKIPLTVNLRYALFDAPYNTRFYAYENDVLYAFSVPAYFYKGMRMYFNTKYDITQKLTIWFKIGQFVYTDREILSPGSLDQIDSNHKTEVKIQIRYKF